MADENDVPPLEDMSELLAQVELMKEAKSKKGSDYIPSKTSTQNGHHNVEAETMKINSASLASRSTSDRSSSSSSSKSSSTPSSSSPSSSTSSSQSSSLSSSSSSQSSSKGIFGFKKGFLLGGSSKPKPEKQPTKDSDKPTDILYIKKTDNQKENFKFPEVQKMMKDAEGLTKNTDAWVTDDLLKKVEQNDDLFKKLGERKYMEAINMFQSNPTQAMERYKHDVEVQEFLKKFMGLMGEHFTNIADKEEQNKEPKRAPKSKIVELDDVEEKKDNVSSPSSGLSKPQKNSNDTVLTRSPVGGADMSVRSSTNPKQPTADDEKRMQEILSDPEIRNILMDQKIFGMIEALRRNPSEGQRIFETADNETKRKIQKLVQCGLLQFQT